MCFLQVLLKKSAGLLLNKELKTEKHLSFVVFKSEFVLSVQGKKKKFSCFSPDVGNRMISDKSWSWVWWCSHAALLDLGTRVCLGPSGPCTMGGSSTPKPSRTRSLNQDNTTAWGSSSTVQLWAKLWIQRWPKMRTAQDTMTEMLLDLKLRLNSKTSTKKLSYVFSCLDRNCISTRQMLRCDLSFPSVPQLSERSLRRKCFVANNR